MTYKINIPEISAEMLLNYLYPELEEKWIAYNEGTFYRNYNNDALSVSPETRNVKLARDGFLKLLPQGFISKEDELRKGNKIEKHKEIEKRKRILQDAFLPLDTFNFRRKIKLEREISSILNQKLNIILKTYFDFDLEEETNSYVKEMATLLPYIKNRRGDFAMIKSLLASFFKCKVNLFTGRYSSSDNTKVWIPAVRYEILIKNLTNSEFNEIRKNILPLEDFIRTWFIPAEMHFEILVKEHTDSTILNKGLTLDYNTKID